jgi:molecular chaperone GrpE
MMDDDDQKIGTTALDSGPTPPDAASATGAGDLAAATRELEQRLADAEAETARLKDEHLRALAEIENTRRRAARDREDAGKYAVTAFARELLTVADNLRRALDAVDAEACAKDPALGALVAGVEMTEKSLLAVFARFGIAPIEAKGRPFDPHFHEAMFEIPDETVPNGTVCQVMEHGYTIHDRPLRAARVGVSKGGPKPEASPATAATDEGPRAPSQAAAYERRPEQSSETSGLKVDETF